MTDPALALAWTGVLAAGLGACVGLHRLGVPSTYVRDLLHVGAGIWVVGWPWWHGPLAPLAVVALALSGTLTLPFVPLAPARSLVRAVTGGDERWDGIALYVAAYAALTGAGLLAAPVPAAAGLWSLSLGDGLGGLVGRRFGRRTYRTFGKRKSFEGSLTVLIASAGAILLAYARFGAAPHALAVALAALAAAVAEALAPRASDNVLVPAAVYVVLSIL